MLLTDLPPDTLDEIVGALKAIRGSSLFSISLVCRAFRSPSQRRIFHLILLEPSSSLPYNPILPPAHHVRLRDILKVNPILATYVKDLRCVQQDLSSAVTGRFADNEIKKPWMVDHGHLLTEILQLLDSAPIRTFALENVPGAVPLNWFSLHSALQSAFLRIFRNSNITSVYFTGLSLPQNIFSAFTANLKHITLGIFTWSPDDLLSAPHPPVFHRPSSLQVIVSRNPDRLFDSIGAQTGLDLTDVRKLQLDICYVLPTGNLTRFISLPKLKDLLITIPRPGRGDNTNFNLSQAVCLRSLTVSSNLFSISTEEFSLIDPTLASLPSHASLKTFTLKLIICCDSARATDVEPFQLLSKTLSCLHRRIRSIRRIIFKLNLRWLPGT
ncbi:hypothetical protein BDN72DRAFT_843754 [Pluteus cervinus]|uniref:Uncharacterized protein n=1 Tax=Pluteus cervinus TaxID=181527 RepID=A0ACD3ALN4_9AGAR|nr:hypothetical protein BDN72DRAFT_843754 [Pluteus cervinus]